MKRFMFILITLVLMLSLVVSCNDQKEEASPEVKPSGEVTFKNGSTRSLSDVFELDPNCTRVLKLKDSEIKGIDQIVNITLDSNIKELGYQAFSGCSSLTSITIPDSVRSIGNNAFKACYSLTEINIDQDKQASPLKDQTSSWNIPSGCTIKWRGEF